MMASPGLLARGAAMLQSHWWRPRPTLLCQALRPLSWLYRGMAVAHQAFVRPQSAPMPVIVVGNLVVGGAGKTPTVMALVQALQAHGYRPGVLSRGYGRSGQEPCAVKLDSAASTVGDEPLLIHRRTAAPVWVGRDRLATGRALCAQHPEVDVLVCDDGLQHHALQRQFELVVFDDRGAGNGLLLPAGPLRQPLPTTLLQNTWLLYTGTKASTALPGHQGRRTLGRAWPLADWWAGRGQATRELSHWQGQPVLAVAGLAAPQKFFSMLHAAGLQVQRVPQPDHSLYITLPWPEGVAQDILVTEKDAVKLRPGRPGTQRVWVVPLDFSLPAALSRALIASLPCPSSPPAPL